MRLVRPTVWNPCSDHCFRSWCTAVADAGWSYLNTGRGHYLHRSRPGSTGPFRRAAHSSGTGYCRTALLFWFSLPFARSCLLLVAGIAVVGPFSVVNTIISSPSHSYRTTRHRHRRSTSSARRRSSTARTSRYSNSCSGSRRHCRHRICFSCRR